MDDPEFYFNDEFFLKPEEAERFAQRHPRTAFAILCPEIAEAFSSLDEQTRACKRRLQLFGYSTIFFGFFALCLAAAEPLALHLLKSLG